MPSRARATGVNLILSSLLATLSYLPFELVAKGTLVICILLFVLDPFPESRLVALAGVMGVLLINRVRQRFVLPSPSAAAASSFSEDGIAGDDGRKRE
eukprot:CAMPEP_0196152456 /NCGR_PEP_ID=MMETSP0910-20130528/35510_1 /TAXON_ID=49265 /ORGANISM="Thalassiosira rotula, Strain GSO102" /LENGTH=97 /DNA_ID=CAMNT_0041416053 /DNA_START=10 /DNA_END=303 /DNA_ORIENTATION=+